MSAFPFASEPELKADPESSRWWCHFQHRGAIRTGSNGGKRHAPDRSSGSEDRSALRGLLILARAIQRASVEFRPLSDSEDCSSRTQGVVSAFNTESGALIWRNEAATIDESDVRFGAGLATAGNRLFVASSAGSIYALNASNGALIWELPLALPLRSAPTVHDGRVFLLTADNRLFALDQSTGTILWQHQGFAESAALLGGPSPAVDNTAVVVPIRQVRCSHLSRQWRTLWVDNFTRPRRTIAIAAMNDIESSPVISGDVVFVAGFGGEMAAVDVRRGIRIWEQKLVSVESPWVRAISFTS